MTIWFRKTVKISGLLLALLALYMITRFAPLHISSTNHTELDLIAMVICFVTAFIQLIYYRTTPTRLNLLLSAGFLGTGILELYHVVLSSNEFIQNFPSTPSGIIAWSWFAPRLYLALIFVILSLLPSESLQKPTRSMKVLLGVFVLTLLYVIFFTYVKLPAAHQPQFYFARPQELVAGFFFILGLIGFSIKYPHKSSSIYSWVIFSLVINICLQVIFMPSSSEVFDPMFTVAHLLKIASFITILVGIGLDISNRFREETHIKEELERKEEYLQRSNKEAKIGYWEINLDKQTVLWSPVTMQIHEVDESYVPTLETAVDFYDGENKDKVTKLVDRAINEGKGYEEELQITTISGKQKWIKAIAIPQMMNGKCVRLYGTFQDIDVQKQAQLMLEESERKFKGIFHSMFTLIGFMNPEGVLLDVNNTALEMAGLQREDVLGKYFWDCYWWQINDHTRAELKSNVEKAARGIESVYEVEILSADHSPVTIHFSLRPILDEHGKVVYIVPEGRPIQDIVDDRNRFKAVLEGTNVGTWEWNVQTGETIFNERWAQMLGYKLEELQPTNIDTWVKFAHPEDMKRSNEQLQACFREEIEFYDIEARMRHRDGHWVWVHDRGKIFSWTDDGKPLLMYGTHQDITEVKAKQKTIEDHAAFQKLIVENMPGYLFVKDSDFRIQKANQKFLSLYPEEMQDKVVGYTTLEEYNEDEKKRFLRDDKTAFAEGHCERIESITFPNGKKRTLLTSKIRFENNDGEPFLLGLSTDITDRQAAEEALRRSEQAFRGNFEHAAVGMALLDKNGKWLKVNKTLCSMVGYTEEEFASLTHRDITHPDDLKLDECQWKEVITGVRDNYQIEKRYIHKKGHEVSIIMAVSVVRDHLGEVINFIFQTVDITEIRNKESRISELLHYSNEQNDRLKNFAHIVSHNLRSHVAGISGILEILKLENPELFEEEVMQLLNQASDNLGETIKHLTEVVQINLLKKDNLTTVSLHKAVHKNISSIAALAKKSDVEINVAIDNDLEVMVLPAYLDSIILNFLTNGIKYRSEGRKSFVNISAYRHKEYVALQFEDNGLGIDLERHRSRLFGMYKTFHINEDAKGLGLFITKNQVDAMGGKIEVESEVNKGTTFTIFFKTNQ